MISFVVSILIIFLWSKDCNIGNRNSKLGITRSRCKNLQNRTDILFFVMFLIYIESRAANI